MNPALQRALTYQQGGQSFSLPRKRRPEDEALRSGQQGMFPANADVAQFKGSANIQPAGRRPQMIQGNTGSYFAPQGGNDDIINPQSNMRELLKLALMKRGR